MDDIVKLIEERRGKGPVTVYVSGLGGSGKTRLCEQLTDALGECVTFQTDWYMNYPSAERRERIAAAKATEEAQTIAAEENPRHWYNWTVMQRDLRQLRSIGRVRIGDAWNQYNGKKDLDVALHLGDAMRSVILVDGIYLLHRPIRTMADITLLMDLPAEEAFRRVGQRDAHRSDPEYLRYKDEITRRYDLPYFAEHGPSADVIVDARDFEKLRITRAPDQR